MILAQEIPADPIALARDMFAASSRPLPYLEFLSLYGPYYILCHVLMILAFGLAIYGIFARLSFGFIICGLLGPLIFGSCALWVGVLQLANRLGSDYMQFLATGHSQSVNALRELKTMPFPFYIGVVLSMIALTVHVARHHNRPHTNVA